MIGEEWKKCVDDRNKRENPCARQKSAKNISECCSSAITDMNDVKNGLSSSVICVFWQEK